jgi:diaminopropionate ammonia-lyase
MTRLTGGDQPANSAQERIYTQHAAGAWVAPAGAGRAALAFHRRLPGYAPTQLLDAADLARDLGLGRVWLKLETERLGLPAFKIMGASWAIYRALSERFGAPPAWQTLDDLAGWLAPHQPLTLVAATDGNHGRAVARMAALLGCAATIYVPAEMAQPRIDAIASENADVKIVHGTYDDAIARAAADADARHLVISDTSWPGYEDVPRWVIEGYSTILWEVDDQLAALGAPPPDLAVAQIGVGALAAAVVGHYRQPDGPRPRLVGAEPTRACATLRSLQAGRLVVVPGPHDSIMAGLNCGTPSPLAYPVVSGGTDLFVAIEDERAREAMRLLAASNVVAGETGAAGLGGLLELLRGPDAARNREFLGLGSQSSALLIITEGATDPAAWERIVGEAE